MDSTLWVQADVTETYENDKGAQTAVVLARTFLGETIKNGTSVSLRSFTLLHDGGE